MKRQRGYSLIEVLIALAITSVVLLTVVTLFYMGRRNVYSGKQMTYAVSVGTRALEDVSQFTLFDVLTNFNIANNAKVGAGVELLTQACPGGRCRAHQQDRVGRHCRRPVARVVRRRASLRRLQQSVASVRLPKNVAIASEPSRRRRRLLCQ